MNKAMKQAVLLFCSLAVSGVATAGDCWVSAFENPATGFGDAMTAKRHAPMLAALRKGEAALKADPIINAIPDVRYQQHLGLGPSAHPGAPKSAQSTVFLHKPEYWQGQCGLIKGADITHFVELDLSLNNLSSLEERRVGAGEQGPDKVQFFHEPRRIGSREGYPIYERDDGNRVLAITTGHLPPYVPVTVGEYLDAWHRWLEVERAQSQGDAQRLSSDQEWKAYIAQLRKTDPKAAAEMQRDMDEAARLARDGEPDSNAEWNELQRLRRTLTSAQRAQPVYLNQEAVARYRFGYVPAGAEGAAAVVKINPALWAGKRSDNDVRAVSLSVRIQDGESTRRSGASHWVERLDVRPYRDLLSGSVK